MTDPVEEVLALYRRKGGLGYGEGVSMNSHALQAAWLAEQEAAGDVLVTAALLHDIGHLLHDLPEDVADAGIDTLHEAIASAWLSQHFPVGVSEPVRLHVAAKRYLCATERGYLKGLSSASVQSLALQGGPMSPAEARQFEAEAHAQVAVRLRRWDDLAKRRDLTTPDFAHFRPAMEAALKRA